jgi:hypothetical protein
VGEAGERPPAHQQPVGLRQPAASPCEAKLTAATSQTAARTKREAPR